jgi:hypothetical protein
MGFFLNPPEEETVSSMEQKTRVSFNLMSKNSTSGWTVYTSRLCDRCHRVETHV